MYNIMDDEKNEWNDDVENLLSRYSDEAMVLEKLNRLEYYKQKKRNNCFKLPIIIFSALSGSIQLLSKQFPSIEQHIITGTASLSIFTSILGSISAYLKLEERTGLHKRLNILWQTFHNKLKHILSLERGKRPPAKDCIEETINEYDRLIELSPIISKEITNTLKKKMKKSLPTDSDFRTPNYINGWSHTLPYNTV